MSRVLGRSGIKVSEVGFGCWAIGGPFTDGITGGIPVGRPEADEAEAAAALRRAFELGPRSSIPRTSMAPGAASGCWAGRWPVTVTGW